MRPERLRVLLLIAILATVAIAVTGIALAWTYSSSLQTQRARLLDLVSAREALAGAVWSATSGDPVATRELLTAARAEAPAIGASGEFTVGRREGDRIVFLVPLRYPLPDGATSVSAASGSAEPMLRALAGEHGTMIGRDYRGRKVLAAFRPVDGPAWGLVAKIDLAEVRAPILRAGGLALAATVLLVALGAVLFTRITSPVLQQIQASETRFRAIFERSQVGKSLTAPDGRLLEVNAAFAEMLGYTVAELEQLDFARVSHPDDVAASRECVRCLLAGERESYRLEKRYLHRDGHVVYADVNTTLLRDAGGAPVYFITGITDITERELARHALVAEKAFSEAMLTSLPGVAYLFDAQLRFRRWNRNFEAVTGYSHEEFAGLSPLDLFRGPDQARVAERIGEVFTAGQSSVEAELVAKDGTRIPYFFTGRQVEIEGEQYLIGVGIDVTERRRAQHQLAELNAQLEQKVAERTRELAHTVEQLGAANQELESFSYTVSHDLRAPLRAIDGFSRILVDEHGEQLQGEARRYLQIVRDNTRHMGQLIDDLLTFSRLSRQELRTDEVDLRELVDEAWRELEPFRAGRRVELRVGELPCVHGDPRLLHLVCTNLLGNALKFTRTRDPAVIEIGSHNGDGCPVCYVKDNGVGFDMRYADKLFGVFQRLHRADQFEGTGVGLATVARIVHRHGGRVWAEAVPDQGATFFVAFEGGPHGTDQSG